MQLFLKENMQNLHMLELLRSESLLSSFGSTWMFMF